MSPVYCMVTNTKTTKLNPAFGIGDVCQRTSTTKPRTKAKKKLRSNRDQSRDTILNPKFALLGYCTFSRTLRLPMIKVATLHINSARIVCCVVVFGSMMVAVHARADETKIPVTFSGGHDIVQERLTAGRSR